MFIYHQNVGAIQYELGGFDEEQQVLLRLRNLKSSPSLGLIPTYSTYECEE